MSVGGISTTKRYRKRMDSIIEESKKIINKNREKGII